jgi:hypothetical protein
LFTTKLLLGPVFLPQITGQILSQTEADWASQIRSARQHWYDIWLPDADAVGIGPDLGQARWHKHVSKQARIAGFAQQTALA